MVWIDLMMCCNNVVWLSEVCYNVFIADSVYYNKLCIVDMLHYNVVLTQPTSDRKRYWLLDKF